MRQNKTGSCRTMYWSDYKKIALELNKHYPQIDVLTLHRNDLEKLIVNTVSVIDKATRPAAYILDDIRFEWFYLKHGNTCSTENKRRLSQIF